jgi:hypothetical protein
MSMRSHGNVFLLCVCALVLVPASAQALEFSGGVSVGGIQVGTEPKLAVSPFAGWLWRKARNFRVEVHNMLSIIPGGTRRGLRSNGGYCWIRHEDRQRQPWSIPVALLDAGMRCRDL